MRVLYSNPDQSVSVIVGTAKATLEKQLGPLTDEQYTTLVKRALPVGVEGRVITDADYPVSGREFRNAWVDALPGSQIDIDAPKAKDLVLAQLRLERDKRLADSDSEMTRALENGNPQEIARLKAKRQALRDATEELKAVVAEGIADEAFLANIKEKGRLKDD